MLSKFIYIPLILFALAFSTCKKDVDELPPTVVFELPFVNHMYKVFDTVPVKALIEDETKLSEISVGLANMDYIPISRTYSYDVKSNPMNLNVVYPIADKFIESGDYYIYVKASDGENVKIKYRKIRILGYPKYLRGLTFITHKQNTLKAFFVDSALVEKQVFSAQQDFVSSSFSSRRGLLFLAGAQDNAHMVDINSQQTLWTIQSQNNPPFPSFTSSSYFDKLFFLSYYDGKVEAYDYARSLRMILPHNPSYRSEAMFSADPYYLSFQVNTSNPNVKQLSFYHQGTGGAYISHTFQKDIVFATAHEKNEVLLMKSSATQGELEVFYVDQNSGWVAQNINEGIVDGLKINAENYIVAGTNNVYWYRFTSSSLVPFLNNVKPIKLLYDEFSSTIYIVEKTGVKGYTFPSGNLVYQFGSNDIVDAHLVYSI